MVRFWVMNPLYDFCAQSHSLRSVSYTHLFHATKGNAEQMVELDNKFHEILYTASGSRELRHVLSDFHHYAQRVRKITLSDKNRAVDSNNEHRRIVEALKQHDAQLAEKLANQHIMKTMENMDDYVWDKLLKK